VIVKQKINERFRLYYFSQEEQEKEVTRLLMEQPLGTAGR
jgi:hypothetical protein